MSKFNLKEVQNELVLVKVEINVKSKISSKVDVNGKCKVEVEVSIEELQ
jgi:hypothetical protein